MNNTPNSIQYAQDSALGKGSDYVDRYSPELLHAIQRADYRRTVEHLAQAHYGHDLWQCYELSWLNARGLPQAAVASMTVPLNSPAIVESKSLKLYLNSLHNERFDNGSAVVARIQSDLTALLQAAVLVELAPVTQGEFAPGALNSQLAEHPEGLLDTIDIACEQYQRDAALLSLSGASGEQGELRQNQWHYSHLLRSHCPVTNQPDWGTVHICYSGQSIEPASLLRYIVSYRQHCGFHEQCVEQIYSDIMQQCQPIELTVYAQYTRRGGLDINPLRSNVDKPFNVARVFRQ